MMDEEKNPIHTMCIASHCRAGDKLPCDWLFSHATTVLDASQ